MSMQADVDVLVIGGGMVGASAACLMARAGFSVKVLEMKQPPEFTSDSPVGLRVSALSPGSQAILDQAGAWKRISKDRHCAYRRMRVEDRTGKQALEFSAGEFAMDRLGTIVENDLVQSSLWECLQSLSGLELVCPAGIERIDLSENHPRVHLQGGHEIRCRVLVGADGPDSLVRKATGIDVQNWVYGQQGIVSVVKTRIANDGVAWQRFLPGGPLALLPLSDGQSSIVWSQPEADVQRLLGMEEAAFCEALNLAMAGDGLSRSDAFRGFGDALECGSRAAFPLHMQLSDGYAAGQAVLIGDAAHVVHPLAGQGVNLGLLDAAALVEILVCARKAGEDFASHDVLRRYASWRRSEAELMARGIHHLRSLFLPEWLGPLRRAGLALVGRSWTLKEAFIRRAAGNNSNAPALAKGQGLSDLLRIS